MSEIVTKIENYDKNFIYKVDKDGNLIRDRYKLWKDPWTLVTLAIIILGVFYYIQTKQYHTSIKLIADRCPFLNITNG
jgi:hypothetical protein